MISTPSGLNNRSIENPFSSLESNIFAKSLKRVVDVSFTSQLNEKFPFLYIRTSNLFYVTVPSDGSKHSMVNQNPENKLTCVLSIIYFRIVQEDISDANDVVQGILIDLELLHMILVLLFNLMAEIQISPNLLLQLRFIWYLAKSIN